jgi:hypothetical protein
VTVIEDETGQAELFPVDAQHGVAVRSNIPMICPTLVPVATQSTLAQSSTTPASTLRRL